MSKLASKGIARKPYLRELSVNVYTHFDGVRLSRFSDLLVRTAVLLRCLCRNQDDPTRVSHTRQARRKFDVGDEMVEIDRSRKTRGCKGVGRGEGGQASDEARRLEDAFMIANEGSRDICERW
jgi:hypothetical protein